jgi:hypothetical protein
MSREFDEEALGSYLDHDEYEEVPAGQYRWLNPWAVGSVVFGLLSVLTIFGWSLGLIPLAGVVLGVLALRQVRRAGQEMMGFKLAVLGIGLSVVLWSAGYGWLIYVHRTQAPPGYLLVSYEMLHSEPGEAEGTIPQAALDLVDKNVFIKGYMYPGRMQTGIKEFILSRDNGVCAYCMPNPKPTDLVQVNLIHGLEASYTTHLIGLGGKFSVLTDEPEETEDEDAPPQIDREQEQKKKKKSGEILYYLEADYIR